MQVAAIALSERYAIIRRTVLATMVCFSPSLAGAQSWNPTASDAKFNTAAEGLALPSHASACVTGNTAVRYQTLHANTGRYNTATGLNALYSNTTSSRVDELSRTRLAGRSTSK
jgi:hypothetical protein